MNHESLLDSVPLLLGETGGKQGRLGLEPIVVPLSMLMAAFNLMISTPSIAPGVSPLERHARKWHGKKTAAFADRGPVSAKVELPLSIVPGAGKALLETRRSGSMAMDHLPAWTSPGTGPDP